ncbi:MAG: imidazole glycerol phosphate synthase subunit HisH [Methylophilaceae bacterium]
MIAIVDYGMGNLRSVYNAFRKVSPNLKVCVTSDQKIIQSADRIVFPGQGAMPDCVRELANRNLTETIINAAKNKPFLGICIGLQMLNDFSEEGGVSGLGIIPGQVRKFKTKNHFNKVPHMGWNEVYRKKNHFMWNGINNNERFYFVHSYFVQLKDQSLSAAETIYEHPFCCAVSKDNIFAVQFHPEKSSLAGLQLLKNFTRWSI